MTRALLSLAAALASFLAVSSVSATTKEEFAAMVMPMSDIEANQRLEREYSALVERGDETGLKALSERVRSESGKALDVIVAMVKRQQELSPPDPAEALLRAERGEPVASDPDAGLILTLGPCQYAGILLRGIATGVSTGAAKPVFRKGTVMIDGNDADTSFAEMMDRCEIIRGKRSPARLIGTRCLTTGVGCMDDPDNAEPAEDQDDKK